MNVTLSTQLCALCTFSAAIVGCRFDVGGVTPGQDGGLGDAQHVDSATPETDGPPPPPQIPTVGLVQDLDGDLGISLSGTTVVGWSNSAPSGGDDVSAARGTVEMSPDTLNGHAVVHFDSSSLAGDDEDAFDFGLSGSGFTWLVVVRSDAQDNSRKNRVLGTLLNQSPYSGYTAGVFTNANGTRPYADMVESPGSGESYADADDEILDTWVIVAGRLSAAASGTSTLEIVVDGRPASASTSIAYPVLDCGALTIGAERVDGGEHFDGDVARILVYERPLPDAELDQAFEALAALYGL